MANVGGKRSSGCAPSALPNIQEWHAGDELGTLPLRVVLRIRGGQFRCLGEIRNVLDDRSSAASRTLWLITGSMVLAHATGQSFDCSRRKWDFEDAIPLP
jgi:hypothetical protein